MAVLILTCKCGQQMKVPEAALGKVGTCVSCGRRLKITERNTTVFVDAAPRPATLQTESIEQKPPEQPVSPSKAVQELETPQPICPHCKQLIEPAPTRKRKCPLCGEVFYVRSTQKIFPSTLLTHEDAISADCFRKDLEGLGITVHDYTSKKQELSRKFGQEPKSTDVIWGLFHDEGARTGSPAYWAMAAFQNRLGQDCSMYLELLHRNTLLRYKRDGFVKGVEILVNHGSCRACKKQNGKVFTIDEALEKMPLPCKGCTTNVFTDAAPFCRCIYLTVIDID
jgi:predicted RNA-binding Zn-ribbon protein involved in translation (DUF1610 family)